MTPQSIAPHEQHMHQTIKIACCIVDRNRPDQLPLSTMTQVLIYNPFQLRCTKRKIILPSRSLCIVLSRLHCRRNSTHTSADCLDVGQFASPTGRCARFNQGLCISSLNRITFHSQQQRQAHDIRDDKMLMLAQKTGLYWGRKAGTRFERQWQ